MEAISVTLLFLAAVVASSVIARVLPAQVPLPLVQIALGAVIASRFDFRIELDPEIFFLLFLPPLLFLDGWRMPREGLVRDRGTIVALALGLVVFTVVGAGYFIHWLIPSMPLPVAFALAAILSPTDPVAVSSIAAKAPIPKRLLHILQGESLLNDASGLVCMRFAIAAAMTGTFSLLEAGATFVWIAGGGLAVGIAVTLLVAMGKDWVSRRFGEDTSAQILISLLMPFGAYVLAERFGVSGILAVVAAGIVMGYEEQSGRALAVTRVRRAVVWDAVHFAANGAIFVLLGEQLPGIISGAATVLQEAGHQKEVWLVASVLSITCALAALRFVWVWATLRLILFRWTRRGRKIALPGWPLLATTSLAGVRGAVTLAGVLTLPITLQDGSPFPARDVAIFLAAGVIVLGLVIANVTLPAVVKGVRMPPEPSRDREEQEAHIAAAQAAMNAVDRTLHERRAGRDDADLYMDAGARIMAMYRQRIESRSKTGEEADAVRKLDDIERRLRVIALRAERDELYRIGRTGDLPDEMTRQMVREIDLLEARLAAMGDR